MCGGGSGGGSSSKAAGKGTVSAPAAPASNSQYVVHVKSNTGRMVEYKFSTEQRAKDFYNREKHFGQGAVYHGLTNS